MYSGQLLGGMSSLGTDNRFTAAELSRGYALFPGHQHEVLQRSERLIYFKSLFVSEGVVETNTVFITNRSPLLESLCEKLVHFLTVEINLSNTDTLIYTISCTPNVVFQRAQRCLQD